jgi:hypothetical protein
MDAQGSSEERPGGCEQAALCEAPCVRVQVQLISFVILYRFNALCTFRREIRTGTEGMGNEHTRPHG